MKKSTTKKLQLNRETMRQLSGVQLAGAAGGLLSDGATCYYSCLCTTLCAGTGTCYHITADPARCNNP